jgi:histidyl-tRNA synthetase
MNDVLPEEIRRWHRVESVFRGTAELFGYEEVRTPVLETTPLFVRQIGEATDVVEKEMYSFERHGDALTVRPEGTAGAARAFVEHGIGGRQPITRWYYLGPMFRGERPAKGRYRQFHQAGCELYGDPGPVADAEMIDLVVRVLRDLGIGDVAVHLNSLGAEGTRERYRDALLAYLLPHRAELGEDSQRRLEKNPLRVLDSKDPKDQAIAAGAPSILDVLGDEDRAHFDGVRRALDALKIAYVVDPRLVRGLDYYTRTLFEVKATSADLGAQSTVCGGGRYDGMIESLGGPKTPAIGFAMGIERLLVAMRDEETRSASRMVYVAALSDAALPRALELASQLRDRSVRVEVDGRGAKLKTILQRAERSGAALCALLGDDEIARGELSLKDLSARTQEAVALDAAAAMIAARLEGPESGGSSTRT